MRNLGEFSQTIRSNRFRYDSESLSILNRTTFEIIENKIILLNIVQLKQQIGDDVNQSYIHFNDKQIIYQIDISNNHSFIHYSLD
jgi:hypothetical protein